MASTMCQAYPTFSSDYNAKYPFNYVSKNFYGKIIVTQDYCVSNQWSFRTMANCKFHLMVIGSSLDLILQRLDKHHFTYQIMTVFIFFTNTDFISIFFHHEEKWQVFNQLNRAVEQNLKGRKPEKLPSVAKKRLLQKNSKNIISVLLRSLRLLRLLDRLFWKGFEK